MDNVRFFLLGDEVASHVFGQAGVHPGQDLGVLAIGVKLLQLRAQASAFGLGGGEGDARLRRKEISIQNAEDNGFLKHLPADQASLNIKVIRI